MPTQSATGQRVDEILDELAAGEARPERLVELARLYAELSGSIERAQPLDGPDTSSLCWAAIELSQPLPGDPPPPRAPLAMLEVASCAIANFGPSDLRATVEYYLAFERRKLGLVGRARERLEALVAELRTMERMLPFLYFELAECARMGGDWSAALAAIERGEAVQAASRATRPDQDNAVLDAKAPLLRALVHLDIGVPDHAFVDLASARKLAAATGDAAVHQGLVMAEISFAEATGDFRGVLARVGELEALAPDLGQVGRADLDYYRGFALSHLARADQALLPDAIAAYERALAAPNWSETLRAAAELHLADLEIRRAGYARARSLLDSSRERIEQASRASASGKAVQYAAMLAALEVRLAFDSDADGARRESALAEIERTYERLLEDWATVPQRRDGAGFLRYDDRRDVVVELVRATLALDPEAGAARCIEHLLRAQALGSLSRALGGDDPSLPEVTRFLCGERRGALLYLPGSERGYALTLDSRGASCFELPATHAWTRTREDWVALVSTSPLRAPDAGERRAEIDRLGPLLAAALAPRDVAAWLSGLDEVSIVGLDLIGYVPFEALPTAGGELLGDRLAITYLPSLVAGAKLARRLLPTRSPGPTIRVVAAAETRDSSAARDLPALEWDRRRERALERAYGSDAVELALGPHATLSALTTSAEAGCAVVEVTAHGTYDTASWPPAGFLLTPSDAHDGRVRCADVEVGRSPALVVLAVCGAARGPQRSGDDGVGDFSGAFFKAGAQCVLLSPVDLERRSTEALLAELHARVGSDGATPAQAMLAARRELADGEFADPYYRCLLHVVGLGHRAPLAARPTRTFTSLAGPILALVALAAGAAIALRWRRRRSRTAAA